MNQLSFPCSRFSWLFVTLQTKFKIFFLTSWLYGICPLTSAWASSAPLLTYYPALAVSACCSHVYMSRHILISRSFPLMFPLPGVLYSQTFMWLVLHFKSLLVSPIMQSLSLTYLKCYPTSIILYFSS